MQNLLGPEYPLFEQALQQPAPISLRFNSAKMQRPATLAPIAWANQGAYLPERPLFTADPRLHAGAYYVQEASSMFVQQAYTQALAQSQIPQHPLRVLDLCAAPGGKSTHLLDLLPANALLVANEVIKSRANILAQNLTKWGGGRHMVTNNDPEHIAALGPVFDLVLVDAPCSGEGLFRKDPQAMQEWGPENVALCTQRQQRILPHAWQALAPGGILLYSTCTYNPHENQQNLAWLAQTFNAQPIALNLDQAPGVQAVHHQNTVGYRFWPHKVKGEGFFIAALQKPGTWQPPAPANKKKRPKNALQVLNASQQAPVQAWLKAPVPLTLVQTGGAPAGKPKKPVKNTGKGSSPLWWAVPEQHLDFVQQVAGQLQVVQLGWAVAEPTAKGISPLPGLALSPWVNKAAFEYVDLPLENAWRYLRKEDPGLTLPKGWVLVGHQGLPLGWAKGLGHRANNYWPTPWRILKPLDQLQAAKPLIF